MIFGNWSEANRFKNVCVCLLNICLIKFRRNCSLIMLVIWQSQSFDHRIHKDHSLIRRVRCGCCCTLRPAEITEIDDDASLWMFRTLSLITHTRATADYWLHSCVNVLINAAALLLFSSIAIILFIQSNNKFYASSILSFSVSVRLSVRLYSINRRW